MIRWSRGGSPRSGRSAPMAASHVATCSSYSGRCSLPETGRHSAPTSSASSTRTGTTSWTLRFKLQPATLRFFLAHRGLGFPLHTSFVQYHSAICRPIDRTVRRPGPRFESRTGSLERQGHWPLDHPLLFFLQMHTIITGADSYYKCRQLLQMQTDITNADSYYKCIQILQMQTVITGADIYYRCRQLLQMHTIKSAALYCTYANVLCQEIVDLLMINCVTFFLG